MTAYDTDSFATGHATGVQVAACVARLAALELVEGSRWWNRGRHRLMARTLIAYADEVEGGFATGAAAVAAEGAARTSGADATGRSPSRT